MLAAFLISFVIISNIFLALTHAIEGRPDYKLAITIAMPLSFLVMMGLK